MKSSDVPEVFSNIPVPDYGLTEAVFGPPIRKRKVALVSTAGLMHRGDRAFSMESIDYRIIDAQDERDLVMSHVSVNFDRTGFAWDYNVVFPIDRLREKVAAKEIGELSRYHYSFMGAISPEKLRPAAEQLSKNLLAEKIDAVILVPV